MADQQIPLGPAETVGDLVDLELAAALAEAEALDAWDPTGGSRSRSPR